MIEVAHRGASPEYSGEKENTIRAFDLAIAKGADWLEFDVRLSKDRVPMILHDRSFFRTFGKRGYIDKTFCSEAQRIGVPTLEEVLLRYDRCGFYIELKSVRSKEDRKYLVEETFKVIERTGAKSRSVLFSFDKKLLMEYHDYEDRHSNSAIPLGLNTEKTSSLKNNLDLFSYLGLSFRLAKQLYRHKKISELSRQKKIFVWEIKNTKQVDEVLKYPGIYGIVHDESGYLKSLRRKR